MVAREAARGPAPCAGQMAGVAAGSGGAGPGSPAAWSAVTGYPVPTGVSMPDPPADVVNRAVGKGGKGGKGCGGKGGKGKPPRTGPGVVSGAPVWVHGGTHRSGFKVHVCGLPPWSVKPLSEVLIRHWVSTSVAALGEDALRQHGMTVDSVCEALVDVNWNYNAESGGGGDLGSLGSEFQVAIFETLRLRFF